MQNVADTLNNELRPETPSEFVTVGEAAKLLRVHPDTIRRWDKAEKIRGFRHPMNDYRLFRRVDLERIFADLIE